MPSVCETSHSVSNHCCCCYAHCCFLSPPFAVV
nr:MAG TPA: hypothetical protein [Microviridae sp.]